MSTLHVYVPSGDLARAFLEAIVDHEQLDAAVFSTREEYVALPLNARACVFIQYTKPLPSEFPVRADFAPICSHGDDRDRATDRVGEVLKNFRKAEKELA